jgi:hypothetical protein
MLVFGVELFLLCIPFLVFSKLSIPLATTCTLLIFPMLFGVVQIYNRVSF